ncbi:MAG: hypothetical protein H7345_04900 [Rubritepida sp.]|nr:hypothetical protein [Rubritepida sp.]
MRFHDGSPFDADTAISSILTAPAPPGWSIYESQFSNPRGMDRGYCDSPAADGRLRVVRNSFGTEPMNNAMGRLHDILIEEASLLAVVHDLNPRALSARCRGFVQARSWFEDYTQIAVG